MKKKLVSKNVLKWKQSNRRDRKHFIKIDKNSYKSDYGESYEIEAHVTEYTLNDGAQIRIFCADYDEKNKLVQNNVGRQLK